MFQVRSRGVEDARGKLFSGEKVNFTEVKRGCKFKLKEKRKALHFSCNALWSEIFKKRMDVF